MRISTTAVPGSGVRRAPQRGFTLLELMVTLTVLGILAAIAFPAMTALINANRLSGMTSEMAASLQLARSEAIRRNTQVSICSSSDGANCDSSEDWSRWIVLGRDNTTGHDVVIRDVATSDAVQVAGPAGGIVFRPSGLIAAEAQLTICAPKATLAENQRVITVMISGNVTTVRDSGGDECTG